MVYSNEFIENFKRVYPNEDGMLALIKAGEETKVGYFLEASSKMLTNRLLDMIFEGSNNREEMQTVADRVKERRKIYEEWKICISSSAIL